MPVVAFPATTRRARNESSALMVTEPFVADALVTRRPGWLSPLLSYSVIVMLPELVATDNSSLAAISRFVIPV